MILNILLLFHSDKSIIADCCRELFNIRKTSACNVCLLAEGFVSLTVSDAFAVTLIRWWTSFAAIFVGVGTDIMAEEAATEVNPLVSLCLALGLLLTFFHYLFLCGWVLTWPICLLLCPAAKDQRRDWLAEQCHNQNSWKSHYCIYISKPDFFLVYKMGYQKLCVFFSNFTCSDWWILLPLVLLSTPALFLSIKRNI